MSLGDLRSRPSVTLPVTLECAGNGRAGLEPRPLSQPWLLEAVGTAEWTGVPLRALLDEVGLRDGATEVLFRGLDRGFEGGLEDGEEQHYERSLPIVDALAEEVLLAYEMNGMPLPPQHGAPLRLVVPGWYGMASVKWLERITVLDQPFEGWQQVRSYRFRQTPDEVGEPVSRVLPRSLMVPPGIPDFLTRERTLRAGPCTVRGRAWSGHGTDRARRGERRRRRVLERGPARRAAGALGLARVGLGLGAGRARRLRALLPLPGLGRQRAAARAAMEPRRLREHGRAAGAREGHLALDDGELFERELAVRRVGALERVVAREAGVAVGLRGVERIAS